jgi:ABC-type sulfate transport system permease subunit
VQTKVYSVVLMLMMALIVYMLHGNVMDGLTVENLHVLIKDYGIVVMANVFQRHMYVMDQLIPVMQVGVQTVRMVQMKV